MVARRVSVMELFSKDDVGPVDRPALAPIAGERRVAHREVRDVPAEGHEVAEHVVRVDVVHHHAFDALDEVGVLSLELGAVGTVVATCERIRAHGGQVAHDQVGTGGECPDVARADFLRVHQCRTVCHLLDGGVVAFEAQTVPVGDDQCPVDSVAAIGCEAQHRVIGDGGEPCRQVHRDIS